MQKIWREVVVSFQKDTTAFIFIPFLVLLLTFILTGGGYNHQEPVWVQGQLVERYVEDDQEIAVLQVREQNAAEMSFYVVHIPERFLEKTEKMWRFNVRTTPGELVVYELSHRISH